MINHIINYSVFFSNFFMLIFEQISCFTNTLKPIVNIRIVVIETIGIFEIKSLLVIYFLNEIKLSLKSPHHNKTCQCLDIFCISSCYNFYIRHKSLSIFTCSICCPPHCNKDLSYSQTVFFNSILGNSQRTQKTHFYQVFAICMCVYACVCLRVCMRVHVRMCAFTYIQAFLRDINTTSSHWHTLTLS